MDCNVLNRWMSFFFLLILSIHISAEPMQIIDIAENTDDFALSEQSYYLMGNGQNASLEDVLKQTQSLPWQFSQGKSPNFGINTSSHWFLVNLKNSSDQGFDKLLSLDSFMPRDVSIYQQREDGSVKVIGEHMGLNDQYSNRPIADNSILFHLHLPAHSQQQIFVQYQSLSSSSFELYLHNEDAFHYRNTLQSLWYGFSYGFYYLAFIACLFLYILSRDRNFLFFSLLILSIFLSQTTQYGHAYQLLPESGRLIPWLWYFASGLFVISVCSFTLRFNKLKEAMPRFHRIVFVSMWVVSVNLIGSFIFDLDMMANIFFGLFIVLVFALLVAVLWNYRLGRRSSPFFSVGLLILFISIVLEVLRSCGFFSAQGIVVNIILGGVMLMVCAFSLDLGVKYRQLSKKSALQWIEKERKLMKAEKAELSVDRTNAFLATMSHEIRTPINGVLGMSEILSTSNLSPQQHYYNNLVISSGKTLLCIINDILDFSKLKSDKLKIERINFKLDEVLSNTLGLYSPQAHKKRIKLHGDLHPDVPVNCIGDPYRLQQVINNLISNAIKFTEDGTVEFSLSGHFLSREEYELQLVVRDSGIGIAQEQINDLFDAFEQADTSTSRQYGGTGLGLAISKRLISLMQGSITVDSTLGQGSFFSVTLPITIDVNKEQERQNQLKALQGGRVILIDESPYNQLGIDQLLAYWGAKVTTVNTIDSAYHLVANPKEHFDIVLLGLWQRRESDLSQMQKLLNSDIQVISMTGSLPDFDLPDALMNKMRLLSEIPTKSEILNTLVDYLGDSVTHYVMEKPKDKHYPSSISVLVAEDNVINQKVVLAMAEKVGISVTLAENGLKALAIYRSESAHFSGILMDCEMPEMDGYTAARAIRDFEKEQQLEPISIVALTAHVLPEHHQRCLDAGINDMLSKPLSLDQLTQAIDQWFVGKDNTSV